MSETSAPKSTQKSSPAPKPKSLKDRLRQIARGTARWLLFLLSKLSRLIYVAITTLLVLLGWLLFTTSGAQWLADRAMDEEPRLAVEVRGGSLWNGLELAGLRWQDAGIDVRLNQAELRWNPLCLLQMQVCLDRLISNGVRVDVDSQQLAGDEDDTDAQQEDPGELNLPVTARFPDVRLRDVDLRVDGHRIAWEQLNLSGVLGRQSLRLDTVDVRRLAVELAEASEQQEAPLEAATEAEPDIAALLNPANRSRVELPEIRLPLDIYLQGLRIIQASVSTADGTTHQIANLGLSADWIGSDVQVRRFQVEHTMVTASLDGRVRLAGDYPLDLELDAQIRDTPAGEALQVNAALWNSLAELEMRVRADGPGNLSLDGSARPLQPEMPVDIVLNWSSLDWPVEEPDLVFSEQGEVQIRGNLEGYAFDASLHLSGREIPAGNWQMAGAGDYTGLTLDRLQGLLLDGRILLSGDLGWVEGLQWDLDLEAEGIDGSELIAEAPDAIQARLTASGSLAEGALVLDADIQRLQAVVQGQDLTASGQISHRPEAEWRIPGLRVDAGESHVELAGSVSEQLELDGSLKLVDLNMFLPELSGAASGSFSARGSVERPDLEMNIEGSGLGWGGEDQSIQVASVRLEASIAALGEASSRLRLTAGGIDLPERDTRVDDVRLVVDGSRADHRLALDIEGAPVELALEVSGALDDRFAWAGALEKADVAGAGLAWTLQAPVPARWDPASEQAVVAPHCWVYEKARLCAPDELLLGASGQASVTLEGYELAWLIPWLPEDIRLLGAVGANVTASWGGGALPNVDAQIDVNEGSVMLVSEGVGDELETIELIYESLSLSLTLDEQQLTTRLGFVSDNLGQADVDAVVDVTADGSLGALSGEVQLQALQLAVAQPFFPELRTLEGVISSEGTLSGDVRDPRFDGTVLLVDGTVEPLSVPVTLTGIRLELALQGNQATLTGGFRSGPGEAEITGEAEWSLDDWDAVIRLSGEKLEFAYDTIATLQANPDLELRIRHREIALTGSIVIPRANITLQQLPEGAVRVSDDVVIVDEQEPVPEEEIPVPEVPGWSLSTDLEIVLGNRVELSGFGLTARLAGELAIQQSDGNVPQATGEIRVEEGEYRAYGQRLNIRQGQFLFAGPVDQPEIYVEAVRQVEAYDVVAGLRLEGRPEEPRVSLFSEPSMPEEDVLAYLVLGRPVSEPGAEGGDMMARAALALGIAGGGGYATAIAEELGIEEFQLDTAGEGDETQFVLSGYLRPNLYLSYGVGVFMPVNELTLRYQLDSNLFLEAVSGLENALDVFYTFEF